MRRVSILTFVWPALRIEANGNRERDVLKRERASGRAARDSVPQHSVALFERVMIEIRDGGIPSGGDLLLEQVTRTSSNLVEGSPQVFSDDAQGHQDRPL